MTDKAEVLFGENREKSTARTEAPTLTAGRTLDALVAAKVLGYRAFKETRGEYSLCVWRKAGEREPWDDLRNPVVERLRFVEVDADLAHAIGFFGNPYPRFSIDLAAAWEVVEKMRKNRWGFALMDSPPPTPWEVTFDHLETAVSHILRAETAPLAVCLAALRAVSVLSQTEEGK